MTSVKKSNILKGQLMSNAIVFLTEENSLNNNNDVHFVKLRHPSSNQPAMFIIGPGNDFVREVLSFSESKRSWFIDENVKSDGKILISTPIDPIFLIIPYLKKALNVKPLEQCLEDNNFPEIQRLAHCRNLKLSLVADRKGDESFQAFKFNEEKTLDWLCKKTKKVAEVIKRKNINVSQATVSANYVNSSKYQSENEMEYLEYAHGIVSEYLDEDLINKLAERLNLPEAKEIKKRKLDHSKDEGQNKKSKIETNYDTKPVKPANKTTPDSKSAEKISKPVVTKKDQARQKAAVGSKSITSFFKKV